MNMAEHIRTLGTPAAGVLAVAAFWFAAWLLGRLFSPADDDEGVAGGQSPTDAFLALLLGADLVALAVLLVGSAGWPGPSLARWTVALGGLGGAALAACEIRKSFRRNGFWRIHPAWLWLLPAGLLLLGPALCLPIGWDEQVYQVAVPLRWLADGFPACYPDLPHSAFPGAGAMPVWLTLSAGGIFAPRLLVLSEWLLLGLGLALLLRRQASSPGANAVLVATLLLSPALLMVAGNVYVELFILLNVVGFLLAAVDGPAAERRPWTAGTCVGAILATKLTGALILPALVLAWCWRWSAPAAAGRWRREAATAAIVGLAFLLPFYLRPWLLTGNPFHPYFSGWFGAGAGELASSEYHHAIGWAKFGVDGLAGWLWSPVLIAWALTVFDSCFGWAYLGVLALAIVAAWRDRHALAFLLMAALTYLGWVLTAQQARFLLPAFLFLLPAAAAGAALLATRLRLVLLLFLATACGLSIPKRVLTDSWISWQAVTGHSARIDLLYTATGSDYLPVLEEVLRQVPPRGKIMLLFENRTLYLPRPAVIATPFFQGRFFTPPEKVRAEDIVAACRREGVTHLLVGLSPADPDRLPAYLDRCLPLADALAQLAKTGVLVPLCQGDGFKLYAIAPPGVLSRR